METRETRDIVIETRQRLSSLESKIDRFIDESHERWDRLAEQQKSMDALVNKGKGAWVAIVGAGGLAGWIGSNLHKVFGGGS
jgi:hypothetical protein